MFASVLCPLHWVNRIPRDGGPSPGPLFIMLTSYPFTLMSLWAPSHFLALFLQPRSFVFIILQLFCKNTRGAVYHLSKFSFSHHRKRWLATWNGLFPAFVYGTNIDAPYHLC